MDGARIVSGSFQVEIGSREGRIEEEVGKIVETLLNRVQLHGGGQAGFPGNKLLKVVVQRYATRMCARQQALFYFRVQA